MEKCKIIFLKYLDTDSAFQSIFFRLNNKIKASKSLYLLINQIINYDYKTHQMKKIKFFIVILASILLFSNFITSDGDKIPSATVKTLEGKQVNTSTFSNDGKPIIISFWATWCKPCKKELDAIAEEYENVQKETGVKLIAISIDDARSSGKVVTDVKTKGWKYEVYIDENQDFKRAMNVNNVPHTFIVDGKGEIVWSHNSYAEGDEEKLFDNVRKLIKGEKLAH
jgi:cytochrome c biogenesis protein CcmG, thiol:disulfide interchange protein DsbE